MLNIVLRAVRVMLPVVIVFYVLLVGWFLATAGKPLAFGTLEFRAEMGPSPEDMDMVEIVFRSIPHLVSAYGLAQLWLLFGAFLNGRTFSAQAVDHLTKFGAALIASVVLTVVINAVFGNSTGLKGLSVDQNQLFQLLIGFVFLLVARAFARARGNAEELERYF